MSALAWLALSDQAWGSLCLVLAGLILLWLLIYRNRQRRVDGEVRRTQAAGSAPEETLSFDVIVVEYELRKGHLDSDKIRIEARLSELQNSDLESAQPEVLLQSALPEEIENLAAIVGLPAESAPRTLVDAIRKAGSHSVGEISRTVRQADPYVPYREVVLDVGKKVKAKCKGAEDDAAIERAIIVSTLSKALKKASPEERARLLKDLDARSRKLGKGAGGAAGVLVVANLSGFGLYVAASSVLGAVTSAVGVTLPFAAYTGMSGTIATLIGPVGWAALLLGGVIFFGRVDFKKTVPAAIAIAAVRCRLIANRDEEVSSLRDEQKLWPREAVKLAKCLALIEHMRSRNLQVFPRSKVPW